MAGLFKKTSHLNLPLVDLVVVLAREAGKGGEHVVGRAQRLAQLVTGKKYCCD